MCARVMGYGPTVVLEAGGAGGGLGETFSGTVEERQRWNPQPFPTCQCGSSAQSPGPAGRRPLAPQCKALDVRTANPSRPDQQECR